MLLTGLVASFAWAGEPFEVADADCYVVWFKNGRFRAVSLPYPFLSLVLLQNGVSKPC